MRIKNKQRSWDGIGEKDEMKAKTVVAIYIRVSTTEQAQEGYSLDAQEHLLTDYCKARKYKVYKIYRDEGISAKDIEHRPGMMELLNDAENKKFCMIIVWKLTRFSRNLADIAVTCDKLDRKGISLVSYSEAFDSTTPAGRMVRSMLGTVAQFEREVISENVKLGMQERAEQGKRTCSFVLGYDRNGKDALAINEEEAKRVLYIYDKYEERKSLSEIEKLCDKNGIRGKRGGHLTAWHIELILTRPIYAGWNLFHGELYKGNHPKIISVKRFNWIQRLIKRQGKIDGRKRKKRIYILPEE